MRASSVTCRGFDVTCCEIMTELHCEFPARLVDVIMKSLSMQLASVDVEASVCKLEQTALDLLLEGARCC